MSEEIMLMARIRDLPTLPQQLALFSDYMRDEHGYDAISYGNALNVRDVIKGVCFLQHGIPDEWMQIYLRENYQTCDTGLNTMLRQYGPIFKSRIYRKAREGQLRGPELDAAVRSQDYFRSGVCFRMDQCAVPTGVALHSSRLSAQKHDAEFERKRIFLTELCYQFDAAVSMGDTMIAVTGLSDQNLRVLKSLASGKRKSEMLEELEFQSYTSIATHMARVRKLLHASSDNDALMRARSVGLI